MLTLQFIPYAEIENLDSQKRIFKILEIAKEGKIVLLEGRLKKIEETELIQKTMEEISSKFSGIELAVINHSKKDNSKLIKKFKDTLIKVLLGNRSGFTIVGPANVVKEIKQDPNKIQLLINESKPKKKKK